MDDLTQQNLNNWMKCERVNITLTIPVYNEEESLKPLFSEILTVMTPLGKSYEIIFVNDGSDDSSQVILEGFREELPEVVKIMQLPVRKGQTNALREGIVVARGEHIVTLDADLQNDPGDILKLLDKLEGSDYGCVCGWRRSRQDTLLKAGLSKFGNILQRIISGLSIHDVSCTLRVYARQWAPKIPLNWEGQHRFIPLSLSLQGCKIGEIQAHHRKRQFGSTKYSHKRIFRVVKDFFKILKAKGAV